MVVRIGKREISASCEPFIIAEMSGNHNKSIERALEIVDAAADAGAHALKLQTYTADTITLNIKGGDFQINDSNSLWAGSNLHDLYGLAYTPWEWHREIINRAKSHGLECFSSPFDESSVDFLEELDVPAYKIASFENVHLPLIERVASTGKPLIISTGMATLGELEQAVNTARGAGCRELILLKCTSTYPADPQNTNIRTIDHLRTMFQCEVGLSDHTMGIGVAVAATALGASVIEKHFTLSRDEGGVDSTFSLEPQELRSLVIETKRAWESLGEVKYGPTAAEENAVSLKRSIYIAEDISEGEKFTSRNIRIIRPGHGCSPGMYKMLLGKKATRGFTKGEPLRLDDLIS